MFHQFYAAMDSSKYLHFHTAFTAAHKDRKDEKYCNLKLHPLSIHNQGEKGSKKCIFFFKIHTHTGNNEDSILSTLI